MNVVMTGDGRFVEVQGTAEGDPFDRGAARRAARPRRQGLRRPHRAPAGRARRCLTQTGSPRPGCSWPRATPRSSQEMQRILAAHLPGVAGARPRRRPGVRRAGRDRADLRGQRPDQGARRRRGHRAAVAGRRQRPVRRRPQRHAGSAVGAMGRAGGRRRTSTRTGPTTSCCSPSSPTSPTSGAARTSRAPSCFARPRRRERGRSRRSSRATMAGRVIRETRGSGGFGYDVVFCADGYDVTTAELPAAGEGRDLAPGQGAARDRAARRRRLGLSPCELETEPVKSWVRPVRFELTLART